MRLGEIGFETGLERFWDLDPLLLVAVVMPLARQAQMRGPEREKERGFWGG